MSQSRQLQSFEIAALKTMHTELKFAESKDEKFNHERKRVVYTIGELLKNPEKMTLEEIQKYLQKFPLIVKFFKYTYELDTLMLPGGSPLDVDSEPAPQRAPEKKTELCKTATDIKSAYENIQTALAPEIKKVTNELKISELSADQRNKLLRTSIIKNDLATVFVLLNNGTNPNNDAKDPLTNPLSEAIEHQRAEAMILLIEKNCQIETYHLSKSIDYLCPFRTSLTKIIIDAIRQKVSYPTTWHQLAYEGKPNELKAFEQMPAEAFTVGDFKEISALHYICSSGNIAALHAFFANPLLQDPAAKGNILAANDNAYLQPPIYWAVYKNHIEFVKILVDQYHADPKQKAWEINGNLLLIAPSLEMQRLLIEEYKLDVNDIDNSGETVLQALAFSSFLHLENVLPLMKNLVEIFKADVNTQDIVGDTPLIKAAKANALDKVIYLLQQNANPYLTNSEEKTALFYAKSVEIAKKLLERGGEKLLNAKDENGYTAFHSASEEVVELLLRDYNVDANCVSRTLNSRLHIRGASRKLIDCLLIHNADINLQNHDRLPPLTYAIHDDNLMTTIHLHQQGAKLRLPEQEPFFMLTMSQTNPYFFLTEKELADRAAIYTYLLCQHSLNDTLEEKMTTTFKRSSIYLNFSRKFKSLADGFLCAEGVDSAAATTFFEKSYTQFQNEKNPVYKSLANYLLAKTYLKMAEKIGFNNQFTIEKEKLSYRKLIHTIRKATDCFKLVGITDYCNGHDEILAIAYKLENMILADTPTEKLSFNFLQQAQLLQVQKLFQLKPLQLELVKAIPDQAKLSDLGNLQFAKFLLIFHESLNLTWTRAIQRAMKHTEEALKITDNKEIYDQALSYKSSLFTFINSRECDAELAPPPRSMLINFFNAPKCDTKSRPQSMFINLLFGRHKLLPSLAANKENVSQIFVTQLKNKFDLFSAVKQDDLKQIEKLLADGADANVTDDKENTPLFYVRSKAAAKCLLKYNADANATNNNDETPLDWIKSPEAAQYLLDYVVAIPTPTIAPGFGLV